MMAKMIFLIVALVVCLVLPCGLAFHLPNILNNGKPLRTLLSLSIVYQSDCGRGEHHLSASISEGNIVVYQGGTWFVDSVQVGDGSDPHFSYAVIDTIQVVWTHNCEHGVLRGVQIELFGDRRAKLVEPLVEVQFGPEQLIAKIPVEWNEATQTGNLLVPVHHDMWQPIE
jgi:hypothetical protein